MDQRNSDNWRRPDWREIARHRITPMVTEPARGEEQEVQIRNDEEEDDQIDHTVPPCKASTYWAHEFGSFAWTPTIRTLLVGVHSGTDSGTQVTTDTNSYVDGCGCPLSLLLGHENTLVRNIYSFLASEFSKHVTLTIPATNVGNFDHALVRFHGSGERNVTEWEFMAFDESGIISSKTSTYPHDFVAWSTCGQIKFPPPPSNCTDLNVNVNMMPFIYGNINSLPPELRRYKSCIDACPVSAEDIGKTFYLTVHECYVDPEKAQRREGLHIEAPGTLLVENQSITNNANGGTSTCASAPAFTPGEEHYWGCGVFWGPDNYEGGIYMASNVSNTSRLYDAVVDNSIPGIVDAHGGCEHLRPLVDHAGTNLQAGQLVWMTDRTPHEALPQERAGVRQFFRLVTSEISHWFEKHSTRNPKVDLPGHVVVVKGDKFESIV